MHIRSFALLLALPIATLAAAQDPTAATVANTAPRVPFGFSLPAALGTLTYSLSGSESIVTGPQSGGTDYSTALSGDLAYLSNSANHPLSVVYSGGYLYSHYPGSSASGNLYGGNSSSSTFQSLAFSQMYRTRRWVFLVSDGLSFLPQSPTTGLSGVAGVGDLGVQPVQNGLEPDQTILTNYGSRIGNGLSGSASWQISGRTTFQGSGSWQTLRFISGQGFDSNSYTGTFGPNYRIDARNSIGGDVYYSRSTYLQFNSVVEVEGVNLQYERVISRRFTASIGVGPQFTHGSGVLPIPSQSNVAVDASLNYAGQLVGAVVSYQRGTNSGSGVLAGANSDSLSVGARRPFGRNWMAAIDGSFSRSSSLTPVAGAAFNTETVLGGAQLSRRIGRSMSGYLSYTGLDQSLNNTAYASAAYVGNAFSGLNHVVAVGLTFSPAAIHRGR